ncbi:MAG: 4-methyl-5(b-hydroxyethyl)-thiazole monophosphate biosynthesis [Colwellia sp.]|jgi:4-methyl-5(b-hydroxyethyl)-thiazole monophosphate biosynthesis
MKKILMLLANGVEPLEMAAFTDVMGWATILGNEVIELSDIALHREIKTTFGLTLKPAKLLEEINIDDYDALAIPGGFEPSGFYEDALSIPFLNTIKHFHHLNKPIASVCVSSIALGQAGILKDKKATTYHQIGGKRKQQLEETGAIFVDRPVVQDQNIITSTGPGTAIEVALLLLKELTSIGNVKALREKMRVPTPSEDWYQTAQVTL